MSSSVHIYADPDTYDVVAGGLITPDERSFQQQKQLNPAHITIDTIVQRGNIGLPVHKTVLCFFVLAKC